MIEKVGIDFPERRFFNRARGKLPGSLNYGDVRQSDECTVLDISVTGAKVRLDTDTEYIKERTWQRLKIGAAIDFPIELVWQDGLCFGLRFLTDPSEVAAALENLLRAGTVGPA